MEKPKVLKPQVQKNMKIIPHKSLAQLQIAFDDETPCKTNIYNGFVEFKPGRINLSDGFRDGHPSTTVNNKNIDDMRSISEIDVPLTYHAIRSLPDTLRLFLFSKIKSELGGERFSSPEEAVEEHEKYVSEVTMEE
ncbi:hypothetical protein EVAR_43764_1 [Eumeta japonica]|uniref:Uncharacterized protein n=1 Tax=Eumeta variegata TaxID=151549 RepID=A0A4C1XGK0_EUMVA|nr:hypothetical protein EVAR_43764_1 [Eumeta japonica]